MAMFCRIGGTANKWSWKVTLSVFGRCCITVQTKCWLISQVRGQHTIQGKAYLETCFFVQQSITFIMCLIIPKVRQISWCTRSSLSVLWLLSTYTCSYGAKVALHCFQPWCLLVSKNHITALFYFFKSHLTELSDWMDIAIKFISFI